MINIYSKQFLKELKEIGLLELTIVIENNK